MSKELILSIDQGTTGSKALLMDRELNVIAENTVDFQQHFPKPGWVEHDVDQIWDSVVQAIKKTIEGHDVNRIAGIGITNQRETVCFWEKGGHKPLARAIVWQDRRTAEMCADLRQKGREALFTEKSGLLLDPYFSGTKVAWALENWGDVAQAAKSGKLSVGTIDSYLLARLSDGAVHATEPSNASRTLAFDIDKKRWSTELNEHLGLPLEIWPEVKPSFGEFGKTQGLGFLPDGIPLSGVVGDQQSALLGQAGIDVGAAKCTYGTGAFLLTNTGSKRVHSKHRLLGTIAWENQKGELTYALEGSAFIAGAAVQWFRDGLGMVKSAPEIEELAASVDSTDGVVFVPALAGLGAPHWDADARGMFSGMTRGTTRAHLARAILEGIAFQNTEILLAMENDLGKKISVLGVDGGASANNLMMQFQSDILNCRLKRPEFLGTTSLGAVFAAGLGVGVWNDLSEVKKSWKLEREFTPAMSDRDRKEALTRWNKAVERVKG
jgi:glycerol kinase